MAACMCEDPRRCVSCLTKENDTLRALLSEEVPEGEPCISVYHNAPGCADSTLPENEWCWRCRVKKALKG